MKNNENQYLQHIKSEVAKNNEIIALNSLNGHKIIFVIDMNNGFCCQGRLADNNIKKIIQPIKSLLIKAKELNYKIIGFTDAHNEHSPEFNSYPIHCLENSHESEIVSELQPFLEKTISKNSTNGFFAFDFKPNLQWENIIITGCCTDICIAQFAISCQSWFNQHNKLVNIFVPKALTNTFNKENHDPELINNLSWFYLSQNGIKIIENFE